MVYGQFMLQKPLNTHIELSEKQKETDVTSPGYPVSHACGSWAAFPAIRNKPHTPKF